MISLLPLQWSETDTMYVIKQAVAALTIICIILVHNMSTNQTLVVIYYNQHSALTVAVYISRVIVSNISIFIESCNKV